MPIIFFFLLTEARLYHGLCKHYFFPSRFPANGAIDAVGTIGAPTKFILSVFLMYTI